jgi:hypothetical protein
LGFVEPDPFPRFAFLANRVSYPPKFLRHLLIGGHNFIESVGYFPRQPGP